MGTAIDAFAESLGIVKRNPLLIAVTVATFLAGGVGGLVLGFVPIVGPFVNFIVVVPLMLAGTVAITNAAATGDASVSDFIDGIETHWKTMMGVYAVLFCLVFVGALVLGAVFAAMLLSAPAGTSSAGAPGGFGGFGTTTLALFGVVTLLALFASLVVQFVDVAVVVGGKSVGGAFRDAWDLFVTAPLSTLGYGVVRLGIVAAMYAVPLVFLVPFFMADSDPTALLALAGLSFVVLAPLAMTLSVAYHVAYYRGRRDLTDRSGRESQPTAPTSAAGWR